MIKYDFEFTRGDSVYLGFETEDLSTVVDSAFFTVRRSFENSSPVLIEKTLGHGITFLNDGVYRVTIEPDDTKNLDLGKYYYDIELVDNGDVSTVIKGQITLSYDITR